MRRYVDAEQIREESATDPTKYAAWLEWWTEDRDLAAIRDAEDLPEEARALWADVAALLERAKETSK